MRGSLGLPSFWLKVAFIAGLVALADWLLYAGGGPGANLGYLALTWTAALALAIPATFHNRAGRIALVAAAFFALLQIERPSGVGLLLYAVAMGVAALSPRAAPGVDVWAWAQRLVAAGAQAFWGPFLDLRRLARVRSHRGGLAIAAIALAALLPLAGVIVFASLFSAANPLIAKALAGVRLPDLELDRFLFWGLAAYMVGASLRPRSLRKTLAVPEARLEMRGVGAASVTISLALFNALFALQNGLDIAFLWTGANLPEGVTFAEYAHQGAYPLIATAILAALFVLVFLRPGSATAASPLVRGLVVVWIAQNLFLVASTILRTIDYVDAYSLTRMRIAALLWMALVAVGLILVLWRLLHAKSAKWLVNGNAMVLGAVLLVCSVVDLGSVTASWNVHHAREVGGRGVDLDLCYLRTLKGAAVVPLSEIERGPYEEVFKARVAYTRRLLMAEMAKPLDDWRRWRWRDARRLTVAEAQTGEPPFKPDTRGRDCHGVLVAPPTAPLTPKANPGT